MRDGRRDQVWTGVTGMRAGRVASVWIGLVALLMVFPVTPDAVAHDGHGCPIPALRSNTDASQQFRPHIVEAGEDRWYRYNIDNEVEVHVSSTLGEIEVTIWLGPSSQCERLYTRVLEHSQNLWYDIGPDHAVEVRYISSDHDLGMTFYRMWIE